MRLKKLHKSLITSFLPPFIATFFIAIFILLMQFLWKWVDELIGKGLEIGIVMQLIYYAAARFVPLALPISMLIASIMTFGNLGERNELAALKSSGVSLINIMKPLIIFSVLIGCLSFLYSNYMLPTANLKNGLLLYDIQKKKPAINIREGEFYNDIDGYSIKIERKESSTNTLYGILIYDHTSNQANDKIIIADSGSMNITKDDQYLELKLFNGYSYIEIFDKERKQRYPHQKIQFKENVIRFDLKKFGLNRSEESIYKNHYSMMSINQLESSIDSLEEHVRKKKKEFIDHQISNFHVINEKNVIENKLSNKQENKKEVYEYAINKVRTNKSIIKSKKDDIKYRESIIDRHKIEWHRKFSLSFACIILFIIGASLGSIIKKGGFGVPVLISILLFIIYHVLNMSGEKQIKEMILEPFTGMWLANMIFLPISIFLLYKASKDSSLMDISYYKQSINNLINR